MRHYLYCIITLSIIMCFGFANVTSVHAIAPTAAVTLDQTVLEVNENDAINVSGTVSKAMGQKITARLNSSVDPVISDTTVPNTGEASVFQIQIPSNKLSLGSNVVFIRSEPVQGTLNASSSKTITITISAQSQGNSGIAQVSCGYHHTAMIKIDGSLWTTGLNKNGQLGDGTSGNKQTFTKIMDDVKQVSCGMSYTGVLKKDGSLWMTGLNKYGQFGDSTKNSSAVPVKVMDDVEQVDCEAYTTAILKKDGSLWTTGNNESGQLGDGTIKDKSSPVKIMDDVMQVSSGGSNIAILKKDGSLWMTGLGRYGALGTGEPTGSKIPVKIMDNVRQVSGNNTHTAILKSDGTLWMTGRNVEGELGDGTKEQKNAPVKIMEKVNKVSCGDHHTGILKSDGTLWMTGRNAEGQLGDGTTTDKTSPIKIMEGVADVECGSNHTAIIKKDGSLWMTGCNHEGEYGNDFAYTFIQARPEKVYETDITPEFEPDKGKRAIKNQITILDGTVKILSTKNKTAAFIKAKNKKTITIPATVKIEGTTYKITQVNKNALRGSKIRKVIIGKNVKVIKPKAFNKSKATRIVLKTKLLKKGTVKGCLKGSKVRTVQVKIGKKKQNKKYRIKYKKIFTKKNVGRKVRVK